jgi:hypothetical protein
MKKIKRKNGKYEICDESLDDEFFENCKKLALKMLLISLLKL